MNKGPDNLTLCSVAALQAGMSYGQFMAMGGYAKVAKQPDKPKEKGPTRVCRYCGNDFPTTGKHGAVRYCSDACRDAAKSKMASGRYYEKRRNNHAESHRNYGPNDPRS